nr:ectoine synthase [Bacillus marinisedimentorum]
MKDIDLNTDEVGTENKVDGGTWISRRILFNKDGMGFSVNDTNIKAGTKTHIWYQNHREAVYCIEGNGEIETVKDGKVYKLKSGILYALDEHNENGVYPLVTK